MAAKFRLESHVKEAMQGLEDSVYHRMAEAVQEVQRTTIETLTGERTGRRYRVPGTKKTKAGTQKYYTASAPGEPPAQRLGELRKSIKSSVHTEGQKLIGEVGTDKKYGAPLEFGTIKMAPRPWLKPSFDKSESEVIRIFNRPMEGL